MDVHPHATALVVSALEMKLQGVEDRGKHVSQSSPIQLAPGSVISGRLLSAGNRVRAKSPGSKATLRGPGEESSPRGGLLRPGDQGDFSRHGAGHPPETWRGSLREDARPPRPGRRQSVFSAAKPRPRRARSSGTRSQSRSGSSTRRQRPRRKPQVPRHPTSGPRINPGSSPGLVGPSCADSASASAFSSSCLSIPVSPPEPRRRTSSGSCRILKSCPSSVGA